MKKLILTRSQVETCEKLGIKPEEYAQALADFRKYKSYLKKTNDCNEKFHRWMSKAYSKLPEGEDFPMPTEFMLEVWQAAWRSAYSTAIQHGQKQGRGQIEKFNRQARTPMSYSTMEDLFEGCKTGREFGLKIEKWHGIFPTEDSLFFRRL